MATANTMLLWLILRYYGYHYITAATTTLL